MALANKQKIVLENEEILLRLLSDLLTTQKEALEENKTRNKMYCDMLITLHELSESTNEIANRLPYLGDHIG